jgi:large conductance mechanosensitive channel
MGFLNDFKSFALKGNVMDLAVGVIIGGAFGKIITAVVTDLLMPVIGYLTPSGTKFNDLFFVLKAGKSAKTGYPTLAAAAADSATVFAYGDFIQTVLDFLIVALCIFIIVKGFERMRHKETTVATAAPPTPTPTEALLTEIRDRLPPPKNP